jgi:hypothetical protein
MANSSSNDVERRVIETSSLQCNDLGANFKNNSVGSRGFARSRYGAARYLGCVLYSAQEISTKHHPHRTRSGAATRAKRRVVGSGMTGGMSGLGAIARIPTLLRQAASIPLAQAGSLSV